jgi:hypothetical protein
MADFLCQGEGCNFPRVQHIRECSRCHLMLCDSCRENASTCKDSSKGKAGCDGHFEERS